MTLTSVPYRDVSFDFYGLVVQRLRGNFEEYVMFSKTIPIRDVYRLMGIVFSLNKKQTRALLRDLNANGRLTWNNQGIILKRSVR